MLAFHVSNSIGSARMVTFPISCADLSCPFFPDTVPSAVVAGVLRSNRSHRLPKLPPPTTLKEVVKPDVLDTETTRMGAKMLDATTTKSLELVLRIK